MNETISKKVSGNAIDKLKFDWLEDGSILKFKIDMKFTGINTKECIMHNANGDCIGYELFDTICELNEFAGGLFLIY